MTTPMRIRYHTTQMTTIAIAVTGLRVVPARLPGPRGRARRLSLVVTVACRQFRRRKSAAVRCPSAGRWPEKVLTVSSRPDLRHSRPAALMCGRLRSLSNGNRFAIDV